MDGPARLERNAARGQQAGVSIANASFIGTIEENTFTGNECGIFNEIHPALVLLGENYWGAPTGPGPDPADEICDHGPGNTIVPTFATKPFKVKATIKP